MIPDEKTISLFVHTDSLPQAEQCLANGVSVDAYDQPALSDGGQMERYTALLDACRRNKTPKVQFLLAHGANVNLPVLLSGDPERKGKSALMLAAEHKNFKLIQLLLEAGADADYQDCEGKNAQSILNNSWLSDYMVQKRRKQFYQAALDSDAAYVSAHLADANATIKTKAFIYTPSAAVAEILLNQGVAVDALDAGSESRQVYMRNWSYSALAVACKENYQEKAVWLLEHQADPNVCWYQTTFVAGMGNVDDEDNLSPLMLCVQHDNVALAKQLLEKGADINWRGHVGPRGTPDISALELAEVTNATEMAAFLKQAGGK